ncbi:hypothetical protein [Methylomonas rosea]|uniref:Uncharacterized protein n=1 Tax=Methylomonas rosea TaxID=2952227 RepID=A0ABT1TW35_9GAMM|nr:hypothetical protein [Methylomonas sp. WSC-7]MCQ8118984.1 hypothetical protein [Methylomonas sp. WSC-7]
MQLKRNNPIPLDDHIIRYIPWAKLLKDEDDNVIGILGTAFKLREATETRAAEKYLSATWLEYFPNNGESNEQITAAIRAMRASNIDVKPKSGFSIGKVSNIQSACIQSNANAVRIVYAPSDSNKAHVAVNKFPCDDAGLCNLLAEEAWAQLILNCDIPA